MVLTTYKEKEYLPITGLADFVQPAMALAYGDASAPIKEKRVSFFFFSFKCFTRWKILNFLFLDRGDTIHLWHRCFEDRWCLLTPFLPS